MSIVQMENSIITVYKIHSKQVLFWGSTQEPESKGLSLHGGCGKMEGSGRWLVVVSETCHLTAKVVEQEYQPRCLSADPC